MQVDHESINYTAVTRDYYRLLQSTRLCASHWPWASLMLCCGKDDTSTATPTAVQTEVQVRDSVVLARRLGCGCREL